MAWQLLLSVWLRLFYQDPNKTKQIQTVNVEHCKKKCFGYENDWNKRMMIRRLLIGCMLASAAWLFPPAAHADTQCPYPGVGILNVNIAGITGGFCDFPTEINGAHWHCQGGGVSLGLGIVATGIGGAGSGALVGAGQGFGGVSCNWRCPDGVDAPAPNPPGMWKEYLVPMNSTNYCKDHMVPNGFWSAPTLPTEGIPPAGETSEQAQLPQPIPPPPPTMPEPQPQIPPLAPGEPNS